MESKQTLPDRSFLPRFRLAEALHTCSLLLLVWGTSPSLAAQSLLIFPRLSFEAQTITGIAIVNPNPTEAAVEVTALDTAGSPIAAGLQNPVEIMVPAGGQFARTTSELFGSGPGPQTIGWIRATSSSSHLTGFFLFLNYGISFFDGADLPRTAPDLILSEVRLDSGFSTELNVINTGPGTALVDISLISPSDTVTRSVHIVSHGVMRLDTGQLFGLDNAPQGPFYLRLTGDQELACFALVRGPGDVLGANAEPVGDLLDTLFFPQLAVRGAYVSELTLINLSSKQELATISAFRPDGNLFGGSDVQTNPVTVALQPQQVRVLDLEQLFGFSGSDALQGWLRVRATSQAFHAALTYAIPAIGARAAVASQTGRTDIVFSHIATTLNFFTGVAVLNGGSLAANLRITAVAADQSLLGSFSTTLQPGQRISKLIEELIPPAAGQAGGFIRVQSDVPVFMTSLFGNTINGVLANIPPQNVPAAFRPDSTPPLQLQPPLAVVAPGNSLDFQLLGDSQANQWLVNGVPGGNPALGTVNGGTYQAPDPFSSRLPLTVSAKSSDQSAGAAVDVLAPEAVLTDSGDVRSVAFLAGLDRLFSAEIAVSNAAADSSLGQSTGTGIFDVTSGNPVTVQFFPGEEIDKMLGFTGVDGNPYLLLIAKVNGQIIRLDPTTGSSVPVAGGLDAPVAAVIDPVTGDLLVAEANRISTVAASALNNNLTPMPSQARAGVNPAGILVEDVSASDLAVDRCDGTIYASLANENTLESIDRTNFQQTTVLSNLVEPASILSAYRSFVPCPNTFFLFLLDRGERVSLVNPRDRTTVPVTFLKGGRSLALASRVVDGFPAQQGLLIPTFGQNGGFLFLLNLSGLFEPGPINAPFVPLPQRGVVHFDQSGYSVLESSSSKVIAVERVDGADGPASVEYDVIGGTATAGRDFQETTGTLYWSDGDHSAKTFSVQIIDDSIMEGDETVRLSLRNARGAALGSPNGAILTIQDVEPGTLKFDPDTYSVNEASSTVQLSVIRQGGSSGPASVNFYTQNGTAVSGSDYIFTSGTLFWKDGEEASKTIVVSIVNDLMVEGTEYFRVLLSNAQGAPLTNPSQATVNIIDNDVIALRTRP